MEYDHIQRSERVKNENRQKGLNIVYRERYPTNDGIRLRIVKIMEFRSVTKT